MPLKKLNRNEIYFWIATVLISVFFIVFFTYLLMRVVYPLHVDLMKRRAQETISHLQYVVPYLDNEKRQEYLEHVAAKAKDLSYLVILDREGHAVAHSDPLRVGMTFADPGFRLAIESAGPVQQIYNRDMGNPESPHHGEKTLDMLEPFYTQDGEISGVVNVGLSMSAIESAQRKYRNISIVSVAIWLIFISGFAILHLRIIIAKRKIEDALMESEASFRALAENSVDVIMRFDRKYRHLYCNPTIKLKTGLNSEDLIGKTHRDVGFPDDLCNFWEEAIEKVFTTGKPYSVEFELSEGTWFDWLLMPETDNGGTVRAVITSARDISDRRRAEKDRVTHIRFLENMALIEHARRNATDMDNLLSRMLEAIQSIFQCDRVFVMYPCNPDAPSWSVPMEYTSADYQVAFQPEEQIPMTPDMAEAFRHILAGDKPVIFDETTDNTMPKSAIQHSFRSCMISNIQTNTSDPWLLGIAQCSYAREWTDEDQQLYREISRRLSDALSTFLSLREMKESQELFTLFMDYLPAVVFIKNEEGRFIYVNKYMNDLHGEDTWLGKRSEDVVTEDIALKEHKNDILAMVSGYHTYNQTVPDQYDKEHVFQVHKFRINRRDKAPLLGSIALDITVHTHVEKEKTRLEDQLRQAQKMEAIGQLAGGIAHDFNNLLQVINGHTDMAIEELPEDAEAREELEEVAKAGERAARLVGQLLAFSRRQIMKPENLDINDVIGALMKMLGRVIGEHIRIDFIPGHNLNIIHADRGMIEQVLMNLCVNARDAMPEGGALILETTNTIIDAEYCDMHPWAKTGKFVMFSVTDNGIGMDENTVNHVFEPFFTTKGKEKGTGLGLATSYGIVKQHNGIINVYSEPGRGTTFKVYLPVSEELASASDTQTFKEVTGGTETILLAEDDQMVGHLTKNILERAGYTVLFAQDGEIAIEMFEENHDSIDMLLFDIVMPNLGGREAYDRIQQKRPNIPVLYTSGYSDGAIHTNFVLNENLTLVQKPFSRTDLLSSVRTVLDDNTAT